VDASSLALGPAPQIHAGGEVWRLEAGDGITVPAGTEFRIVAVGAEPFEAAVCVPAGMRARVEAGEPFVPPWAV
jgi:quercetin dioxygenase-like cupin family protein